MHCICRSICALLVSTILSISCREGFLDISSKYFCVPLLISPSAPITTEIAITFPHFHIFFGVFIFGKLAKFFQRNIFISGYSDIKHGGCSFSEVFDRCVWSICMYFSIRVNRKVAIVPLHFFLLLLVLMCVLTIFLSWVSHNAYILSNVYTCYGYSYISL